MPETLCWYTLCGKTLDLITYIFTTIHLSFSDSHGILNISRPRRHLKKTKFTVTFRRNNCENLQSPRGDVYGRELKSVFPKFRK